LQKKFNLNEIIKIRVLHCSGLGEGMIDEKIADLETLSNPTVGLSAHTGVVDIRIAAKAKNEPEADAMIAQIESQVRERLGRYVFGADEDTLEKTVLDMIAKRGWTLAALESNLGGILLGKLPRVIQSDGLTPSALAESVRGLHSTSQTDITLGVAAYPDDRSAEMFMITPRGEMTHHITYGGPPRSLPRWSMSLALNWLRATLEEMD
jgi:nicotinamide-nucleotide amidase